MSRFKFFLYFTITVIFVQISCKKHENKKEPKKDFTDFFRFDLVVNIQDTTDLILYYKDGSNEWFVDEKTLWQTIPGSQENQFVMFLFEDGSVPNDFRLDIGRNVYKNQKDFEIISAIFYYKGNKFEITQWDFDAFFRPNQYIIVNSESYKFSLKPDDSMNFDPFFETTPALYPKLARLVLD